MALSIVGVSRFHCWYLTGSVVATGTNASDEIPSSDYKFGTVQVVWAGVATGIATFEVQTSNNGTNWDTITGTSTASSGTDGSTSIELDICPGNKIRIKITATTASAGTLVCSAVLKR